MGLVRASREDVSTAPSLRTQTPLPLKLTRSSFSTLSHTRHPTGLALGSLSLNLALPHNFTTDLAARLASLLPAFTALDLSIPALNDPATRLAPRSRDENLESGRLQLAPHSAVLVDLRGVGEGRLEDGGVRNLHALATAVAQQKLEYAFPFSSFELETDLNFVLLSEGKAIIPADCVVYVRPAEGFAPAVRPSEARLDQFRSFLGHFKHTSFDIPADMSEASPAPQKPTYCIWRLTPALVLSRADYPGGFRRAAAEVSRWRGHDPGGPLVQDDRGQVSAEAIFEQLVLILAC